MRAYSNTLLRRQVPQEKVAIRCVRDEAALVNVPWTLDRVDFRRKKALSRRVAEAARGDICLTAQFVVRPIQTRTTRRDRRIDTAEVAAAEGKTSAGTRGLVINDTRWCCATGGDGDIHAYSTGLAIVAVHEILARVLIPRSRKAAAQIRESSTRCRVNLILPDALPR